MNELAKRKEKKHLYATSLGNVADYAGRAELAHC